MVKVMQWKLRFNSPFDLWEFKETVQVTNVEVLSEREHVLVGNFDEAELELANRGFKAEMITTDLTPANN
jgi:hypothetical protein